MFIAAFFRVGDCLISIDGKDLLGLKIKQIAELVHHYQECNLKLSIWRFIEEEKEKETGIAIKGPLPEVACKLANAVAGVVCNLILKIFKNIFKYILQYFIKIIIIFV